MLLVFRIFEKCISKFPFIRNLNEIKYEVSKNYRKSEGLVQFFRPNFTLNTVNLLVQNFKHDLLNSDRYRLKLEVVECVDVHDTSDSQIRPCESSENHCKKKKRSRRQNKKFRKTLLTGECQFSPTSHKFSRYVNLRRTVLLNHSPSVNFSTLNFLTEDTSVMTTNFRDVLVGTNTMKAAEEENLTEVFKKIRCNMHTPYGKHLNHGWFDPRAKQGVTIKILSYNILAQSLLEMHPYLYTNHQRQYLTWEYRSQALMKEFAEFDADVLCLQEIEAAKVDFFNRELGRLGYRGVFKKRTHDKNDGCAVYFREDAFELREFVSVEYYQPTVPVLDRDNIGVIIRLSPKQYADKQVVVATTHLLFNPRRSDVKLAQMQLMLAEIDRVAFKCTNKLDETTYYPVILTGDLNSDPCSCVYGLLTNGWLSVEGFSILPPMLGIMDSCQHDDVCKHRNCERTETADFKYVKLYNSEWKSSASVQESVGSLRRRNEFDRSKFDTGHLSHNLNLASVYQHYEPEKKTATTFQCRWCTVDYIFYGPMRNFDHQKVDGELKLVSYLQLPSTTEATILKGIPNEVCASDHLPLLATFHLPADL